MEQVDRVGLRLGAEAVVVAVGSWSAADSGAVGSKSEAAIEFTGGGTVSRGWYSGAASGEHGGYFGAPVRVMIATKASAQPTAPANIACRFRTWSLRDKCAKLRHFPRQ